MFVVCERWAGDRDRLLYWPKVLLATIAAPLPHLGWGCSTVGHWGPKALCLPLALTSASCLWLKPSRHMVIILSYVHLLPLFFLWFTQVHLLIDCSVEGQYITYTVNTLWKGMSPKPTRLRLRRGVSPHPHPSNACPRYDSILFNDEASEMLEYSYLSTPPLGQDMAQGQFFKRSLTGLNFELD